MKTEKKEQRARDKLAELFGLQEHVPTEPEPSQTEKDLTNSRQAEAVIEYITRPQLFKQVECKQCGGVFATNRGNVSYCSDTCRKHKLAELGIVWDPTKPQELRWDYREPLIVPPPALVVADLAVEMLIQAEQDKVQVEQTSDVSSVPVESEPLPTPIVYSL